jgi:hypothetical protein
MWGGARDTLDADQDAVALVLKELLERPYDGVPYVRREMNCAFLSEADGHVGAVGIITRVEQQQIQRPRLRDLPAAGLVTEQIARAHGWPVQR